MLAFLLVLGLLVGPMGTEAFPLWGDESVGVTQFHQAILMQGDDPSSSQVAPRDQVQVIDRSYWSIPWNSSEVYTYISPKARNVSVDHVRSVPHQGGSVFVPGQFSAVLNPDDPPATGWMAGDAYRGYYYWRFPEGVSRDVVHTLVFENSTDFGDADPILTATDEWNVTGDTLSLASNVSSSTWVSKRYTGGVDITSVNMSVSADLGENMTFHVSTDNGTSWSPILPGTPVDVDDQGFEFRWRVTMDREPVSNATPVLHNVSFDIEFTPETTDIWLEAQYTLDIIGGSLEFSMTHPFDVHGSSFIFVGHVDTDMSLQLEGANLTRSDGSVYPGKVTYTHMGGARAPLLAFTIKDLREDDEGDTSLWLYVGILVLVIMMVIGIAMVITADNRSEAGSSPEDGTEPGEVPDTPTDDHEALEVRKAELLEAISELDEDHEIGLIDDEEFEERRRALKAEAVEVMKRIDRPE